MGREREDDSGKEREREKRDGHAMKRNFVSPAENRSLIVVVIIKLLILKFLSCFISNRERER